MHAYTKGITKTYCSYVFSVTFCPKEHTGEHRWRYSRTLEDNHKEENRIIIVRLDR